VSQECIFCKIAAKQIPAQIVYEDEQMVVFRDLNPVAPEHVLLIPKRHIPSLREMAAEDQPAVNAVMAAVPQVANLLGLTAGGFRLVTNTGEDGGQTVGHLHWHLMGGRKMTWPPG
jgi:histidine triad (HIT) family protein